MLNQHQHLWLPAKPTKTPQRQHSALLPQLIKLQTALTSPLLTLKHKPFSMVSLLKSPPHPKHAEMQSMFSLAKQQSQSAADINQ